MAVYIAGAGDHHRVDCLSHHWYLSSKSIGCNQHAFGCGYVRCRPALLGRFENYRYALTNPDMLLALRNNALWLLLMVPGTIAGGLFFALLADRVPYENIAFHLL